MSTEVDHSNPITLSRFILAEKEIQGNSDLSVLFSSIELACKVIASAVRRAGLTGLYGLDGSENATGDQVKKLDVLSNSIFINSLKDILQPGNQLVAAGYCMYGSSTQLVLTWGNGVHCFTLDPTIGAFMLSQKNIRIPDEPKTIYSCNEGNYAHWDRPTKAFVDECKNKPTPYNARYVGSMVSDVHRTILYGGIYLYPGSDKSKDGKLRLLYEGNPMSFIMEQAGGMSTTGTERILDLVPVCTLLAACDVIPAECANDPVVCPLHRLQTDIHQRAPIFLGCKRDVQRSPAALGFSNFKPKPKQNPVIPDFVPSVTLVRSFILFTRRFVAARRSFCFRRCYSPPVASYYQSIMSTEVDHSNPITLSRFILAEKDIQGNSDLSVLFSSIELACKVIASAVRRAGLTGLYGLDGSENATGDQVKKLDVLSNDIFINSLKVMVSEEEEKPIVVDNDSSGSRRPKYCIAFDPLDGSSNIDCNVSTGTIFAIYQRNPDSEGGIQDILQQGKHLVAAGYCMYGSSTQLVLTWGNGVHCFTLDPTIGAFMLSQKNIRIPDQPKTIYSCNEGNYAHWDRPTKAFVDECKTKPTPYNARYVGSMVSDVHRTILYGGIYLYPGSDKSKDGKLRLLYEGNPMSFIMEQAGGMSTTGTERILDLVPVCTLLAACDVIPAECANDPVVCPLHRLQTDIHQRAPIFLGCKRDVQRVIDLYKEYSQ
ncbi:hypothetical protein BBJ28_00002791 [Nothophytophthora sp. Chile5]|nr:hypothetical protein BBJ28_00002791 [Nothophytophthora sp. Chile5]